MFSPRASLVQFIGFNGCLLGDTDAVSLSKWVKISQRLYVAVKHPITNDCKAINKAQNSRIYLGIDQNSRHLFGRLLAGIKFEICN